MQEISDLVYEYSCGVRDLEPQFHEPPDPSDSELYLPELYSYSEYHRWDSDPESIIPSYTPTSPADIEPAESTDSGSATPTGPYGPLEEAYGRTSHSSPPPRAPSGSGEGTAGASADLMLRVRALDEYADAIPLVPNPTASPADESENPFDFPLDID